MKKERVYPLVESAIMLSLATLLSAIPLVKLPFGGSITACSMLPLVVIAYRRGPRWGLFTGLAFGLVQMLLGLDSLSYATSFTAAVTILAFDYIVAFTLLGCGGLFRHRLASQPQGMLLGAFLVCLLRYICHVVTGCTVWAGVSVPSSDTLLYSMVYNATYMVPETLITLVGAAYIARILDFRGASIVPVKAEKHRPITLIWRGIGNGLLAASLVYTVQQVFSVIQGEGGFDITGITQLNMTRVLIVLGGCALGAVLFHAVAKVTVNKAPSK